MNRAFSIEQLKEDLAAGRVVPVVGAGVSRHTANLPDWRGMIESALNHALAVDLATLSDKTRVKSALDRGDYTTAALTVKHLLGAPAGEYPTWLKATFATNPESRIPLDLIDAIANLLCPLVATTNYDLLLSQLMFNRPLPVTWREPSQMQEAMREGGRGLHLHGVYTEPSSVVMGVDDYEDLAASPAYLPVLRTLWLERTLLFIGCSFGGLRDPDFGKLLEWAARVFQGAPSKHYALIREAEWSPELQREFLLKWRVQPVRYGPEFCDLPAFIERFNPNRERAFGRRVRVIQSLIETSAPDVRQRLITTLSGFTTGSRGSEDLSVVADALLQKQHLTADQQRNDLRGLQQLARSMIDESALEREIQRWEDGSIHTYAGAFRDVVVRASAVIALFPDDLLRALKRRRVDIHANLLDGFCWQVLDHLEQYGNESALVSVRYYVENAKRILTSLRAALKANPETLFQNLEGGTRLSSIDDPHQLLVARTDRIELRRCVDPHDVIAVLPTGRSTPLRGADLVSFGGDTAVCAYNSEALFVWDFRRAATPIANFTVAGAYGICGVSHAMRGSALHSLVATIEGPVHVLVDFKEKESWPLPGRGCLKSPVLMEDGVLFGLVDPDVTLVQVDTGDPAAQPRTLCTKASLLKDLETLPGLRGLIEQRLEKDRAYRTELPAGKAEEWAQWSALHLQFPRLVRSTVKGKALLSLRFSIHFFTARASLVLLFQPVAGSLSLMGYWYADETSITDVSLHMGTDERLRLVYSKLSDFHESYDLIGWARGTPAKGSLIFVEEGSTLRTYDDVIGVATDASERGFACDDSGGLFMFSFSDGSFGEFARDRKSKVSDIKVVHF